MIAHFPRRSAPQNRQPSFSEAFLERVYAIPQPMLTYEELKRSRHQDLDTLLDRDLLRERRCVQHRLDYDRNPSSRAWLMGRLTAIDRERGSRHAMTPLARSPRPTAASSRPVKGPPDGFEYRRGQVVER
jgi:hypothetical protein